MKQNVQLLATLSLLLLMTPVFCSSPAYSDPPDTKIKVTPYLKNKVRNSDIIFQGVVEDIKRKEAVGVKNPNVKRHMAFIKYRVDRVLLGRWNRSHYTIACSPFCAECPEFFVGNNDIIMAVDSKGGGICDVAERYRIWNDNVYTEAGEALYVMPDGSVTAGQKIHNELQTRHWRSPSSLPEPEGPQLRLPVLRDAITSAIEEAVVSGKKQKIPREAKQEDFGPTVADISSDPPPDDWDGEYDSIHPPEKTEADEKERQYMKRIFEEEKQRVQKDLDELSKKNKE